LNGEVWDIWKGEIFVEEKVKDFDKKRKKYEDYDVVVRRFVVWILEGSMGIMAMIPVQEVVGDFRNVWIALAVLSGVSVSLYLDAYMTVVEKGKQVSVYQKLRYVPVSVWDVFRVRLGYLRGFCEKKLVVYLVGQVAVTLIALRTISAWNVFYPVLWVGITSFLPGFLRIYPWKSGRRLFSK
jgi:hypothetical protein